MLPDNPRRGAWGLPTNPSPRSRTAAYSKSNFRDSPPSKQFQYPRQTEHYLSPALTTHRSQSRPPYIPHSQTHDDPATSIKSPPSNPMRTSLNYKLASPALEEKYRLKQSQDEVSKLQKPRRLPEERPPEKSSGFIFSAGDGPALWGRVATVANTLTISVSKAWAANVTTYMGEDTPPGQDSRLIRAMKAYHLDKAQNPTDLPSWLFDDFSPGRRHGAASNGTNVEYQEPVTDLSKFQGFHDTHRVPSIPISAPQSKATNRLKATREANRSRLAMSTEQRSQHRAIMSEKTNDGRPGASKRGPRTGLPSGPRGI